MNRIRSGGSSGELQLSLSSPTYYVKPRSPRGPGVRQQRARGALVGCGGGSSWKALHHWSTMAYVCFGAFLMLTVVHGPALAPALHHILHKLHPEHINYHTSQGVDGTHPVTRNVCILSADTYGAEGMAGTATAYWLLAHTLLHTHNYHITWISAPLIQHLNCTTLSALYARNGIGHACLDHVERSRDWSTSPYERLGTLALGWLESNVHMCDVLHVHEWGGIAREVLAARRTKGLFKDVFVVVGTHGGHMWSRAVGNEPRPADLFSLSTDYAEQSVVENADAVVSPSRHMLHFLYQRGWAMRGPKVVPNIIDIPRNSPTPPTQEQVPVWRVAFFGRLEPRKGLRLFVRALSKLQLDWPGDHTNFSVTFVGSLSDPSSAAYVRQESGAWPWPVYMMSNLTREEALAFLRSPGVLAVSPSLHENAPYALAECAAYRIPTLVANTGGTEEMLERATAQRTLVEPTVEAFRAAMLQALQRGKHHVPVLAQRVLAASQAWLDWHARIPPPPYARTRQQTGAPRNPQADTIIKVLKPGTPAVPLWKDLCSSDTTSKQRTILLTSSHFLPLVPDTLSVLHRALWSTTDSLFPSLDASSSVIPNSDKPTHAVIGGVKLPNGEVAIPTGPLWLAHVDRSTRTCLASFPILTRRDSFCAYFSAEARTFNTYSSWLLALFFEQADHDSVATVPYALHELVVESEGGGEGVGLERCTNEDHPVLRDAPRGLVNNLATMEAMWDIRMKKAKSRDAVAVSNRDASSLQGDHGWFYAYAPNMTAPAEMLQFNPDLKLPLFANAKSMSGAWSCPQSQYPQVGAAYMHPCGGGHCCNGASASIAVIRYDSYVYLQNAEVNLHFNYNGECGDGVDIALMHQSRADPNSETTSVLNSMTAGPGEKIERGERTWQHKVELNVGDYVEARVGPRGTQDCDGVEVNLSVYAPNPSALRMYKKTARW